MKTVVIIGRPNVGKSTLFNRLIGKRRAITDQTAGVTRDLIHGQWIINGVSLDLVDSGGVKIDFQELDKIVAEKSLSLLESSDLIIFLMDCTDVNSEDLFLIEKIRAYIDKTLLVVNKIDDTDKQNLVWNYYQYGFQRVLGVSSAHGLGIGELEETVYSILNLDDELNLDTNSLEDTNIDGLGRKNENNEEKVINLAVLGKPNTGKSTLVNLLSSEEISIVSQIPGTTRDVVNGSFVYKDYTVNIYDTAGIRRKSKVEEDVEYYSVNRAIKAIDDVDIVLLMISVEEGLTEQDKKIANLVVRRGKGLILVLNKEDLLKKMKNEKNAMTDRVRFLFPHLNFAPICYVSSLKSTGIPDLVNCVINVKKQLNKRISTSVFNQNLTKWITEHEIQRGSDGYFKIFYGTQVSANPVKFLLFVNKKKGFPDTYILYLKNKIRKELGFSLIPIEINLRERERSKSKNL